LPLQLWLRCGHRAFTRAGTIPQYRDSFSQAPVRWVGEVALASGRARSTVSLPFSQAPTRWSAGRAHYTQLRCRCRWRTADGRASGKDASALALVWSAGFFYEPSGSFFPGYGDNELSGWQHPSPSTGLFVEVEVRKVLWIRGEYRVVLVCRNGTWRLPQKRGSASSPRFVVDALRYPFYLKTHIPLLGCDNPTPATLLASSLSHPSVPLYPAGARCDVCCDMRPMLRGAFWQVHFCDPSREVNFSKR